ncbi:MAG: radical SAM family heme chaperone HemW [Actinobacteria bacterium]|nr:radical SAM family heme chaperone HemW [Actinomycetota bacterium]
MAAAFGVYLHIPFCAKRCDYCAFATWTDRAHLAGDYLRALHLDIERSALAPVSSVFVGGGTPTFVDPSQLASVLRAIPAAADAETTVECNPDDVTPEMLRTYRDAGVNRVSIGVQSMVPHVLASLGRSHLPANVHSAVAAVAEAGIATFNLDLIYGAVGESLDDWRMTLEAALALEPTHISAYALTVEAGTPLALEANRHPDDDDLADKYQLADELLSAAGLGNYEVSNWSRVGHECRHNMLYWRQGNYRGFGSAAHSHHDGRRWWNVRTPERYIAAVMANESTEAGSECLDARARHEEGLQLAIRMREGVPAEALPLATMAAEGWDDLVESDGRRVRLTQRGRLLANEVSLRLR